MAIVVMEKEDFPVADFKGRLVAGDTLGAAHAALTEGFEVELDGDVAPGGVGVE